jgi:hypothetical protein
MPIYQLGKLSKKPLSWKELGYEKPFSEFGIEEQIAIQDKIKRYGHVPKEVLLAHSQQRDHSWISPNCTDRMDGDFQQLKMGHEVRFACKVTDTGDSYHWNGFLQEILMEPEISIFHGNPSSEQDIIDQISSNQNIMEGSERYFTAKMLSNIKFREESIEGIIKQPPTSWSSQYFVLTGGETYCAKDITILHIIGVDSKVAKQERKFLQRGDKVEVNYPRHSKWYEGTVADFEVCLGGLRQLWVNTKEPISMPFISCGKRYSGHEYVMWFNVNDPKRQEFFDNNLRVLEPNVHLNITGWD